MKKNNPLLKFICSIGDIMIIWSLPFVFIVFFWVCTLGSFAYLDVVHSVPFGVCDTFYSIISLIVYCAMKGGEDEISIIQ